MARATGRIPASPPVGRVHWLRQVHGSTVVVVPAEDGPGPGRPRRAAPVGHGGPGRRGRRPGVGRCRRRPWPCSPPTAPRSPWAAPRGSSAPSTPAGGAWWTGWWSAPSTAMRAIGATEVVGALGPCIHPECYEFSDAGPRPGGRGASATGCGAGPRPAGRPWTSRPRWRRPWPPAAARQQVVVVACTACGRRLLLPPGPGRLGPPGPGGLVGRRGPVRVTAAPARFEPTGSPSRLDEVRRRIGRLAPIPASVRLVAVTKGFGPEAVRMALAAGLDRHRGELCRRAGGQGRPVGRRRPVGPARPVWHFLGAVQRNKVARLAPLGVLVAGGAPARGGAGHRPPAPRRDRAGPGGRGRTARAGGLPARRRSPSWWRHCGTRTSRWPA